MRQAKIRQLIIVSRLPDREEGKHPFIKVITDWSDDNQNSFYIDPFDKNGIAVTIPKTAQGSPENPNCINWHDEIIFDKQCGFSKEVIWKGRRFRQRGYSFDDQFW